MTKAFRLVWWLYGVAGAVLWVGCAGRISEPVGHNGAAVSHRAEVERLRQHSEQQQERLRELEARIALLEAEAEGLRHELDRRDTMSRETVRIAHHESAEGEELGGSETSEGGRRPLLQLYGSREVASAPLPYVAPNDTLPVAPLPDANPATQTPPMASTTVGETVQPANPAVFAYRKALSMLQARKFEEARAALVTFVSRYPTHPYADNAVFWTGEILYAFRNYRGALQAFERILSMYRNGNKVRDAILRAAQCYEKLGDRVRARELLRRMPASEPQRQANVP